MDKYNQIFDIIQESVNSGEIDIDTANKLNEAAYATYVEGANQSDDDEDAAESATTEKEVEESTITEADVNAMRLRVFDAFESGVISEDDKVTMLALLDVNNYE